VVPGTKNEIYGLGAGRKVGCSCFGGFSDNQCSTPNYWSIMEIHTTRAEVGDADTVNDPDPYCKMHVKQLPYLTGHINPDIVSGTDKQIGSVVALRTSTYKGRGFFCMDQGSKVLCNFKSTEYGNALKRRKDRKKGKTTGAAHFRVIRVDGKSLASGEVYIRGGRHDKYCGIAVTNNVVRCDKDAPGRGETWIVTDSGFGDGSVKIKSALTQKCWTSSTDKASLLRASGDCAFKNIGMWNAFLPICENCGSNAGVAATDKDVDTDGIDYKATATKKYLQDVKGMYEKSFQTRRWDNIDEETWTNFDNRFMTAAFDAQRLKFKIECWDHDWPDGDDFLGDKEYMVQRAASGIHIQEQGSYDKNKPWRHVGSYTAMQIVAHMRNPHYHKDEWMNVELKIKFITGPKRQPDGPQEQKRSPFWSLFKDKAA